MRNLFIISLLLSGALIFSSCKKDSFLKEVPTNIVNPEQFFQNAKNADIALNGVYNIFGIWNGMYQISGIPAQWGFCGTDVAVIPSWQGDQRLLAQYTILPTNSLILDAWRDHYIAVSRANQVIDRVSQMPASLISDKDKNRILGEARFLRGFFYFQMAKIWGGVPLSVKETTTLENLNVSRAPVDSVYAQVIADLKFAEENLEPGLSGGHATQGAAKALLGKVYLQMTGFPLNQTSMFALAASKFKEVIDANTYALDPNYADVFDFTKQSTPEVEKEVIFAVQYISGGFGIGSDISSYMGATGALENGGGYGTTYANTSFSQSYDTNDMRFQNNIARYNLDNDQLLPLIYWRPWKWHKPKGNNYGYIENPFNLPLIRYSDVLLGYAEALNGINNGPTLEAYNAINLVRKRARGNSTDPSLLPDLQGLSQAQFLDALLKERAWELAYEGVRKEDLIRTDKLQEVLMAMGTSQPWGDADNSPTHNYQPYMRLWPIPSTEIDINPSLTQNEGY